MERSKRKQRFNISVQPAINGQDVSSSLSAVMNPVGEAQDKRASNFLAKPRHYRRKLEAHDPGSKDAKKSPTREKRWGKIIAFRQKHERFPLNAVGPTPSAIDFNDPELEYGAFPFTVDRLRHSHSLPAIPPTENNIVGGGSALPHDLDDNSQAYRSSETFPFPDLMKKIEFR